VSDPEPRRHLAIQPVVEELRARCPFNAAQGPAELIDALEQELRELRQASMSGAVDDIREELGDVLFNLVALITHHADADDFTLHDVDRDVAQKMMDRHPYVFGDQATPDAQTARAQWAQHKARELHERRAATAGLSIVAHLTMAAPPSPLELERGAARVATALSDSGRSSSGSGRLPSAVLAEEQTDHCAVMAHAVPDRRIVQLIAFTVAPLDPGAVRGAIADAFEGATTSLTVRSVPRDV
jgi:NTP pyrophosphatase (non-canonical NTP hydrolase)